RTVRRRAHSQRYKEGAADIFGVRHAGDALEYHAEEDVPRVGVAPLGTRCEIERVFRDECENRSRSQVFLPVPAPLTACRVRRNTGRVVEQLSYGDDAPLRILRQQLAE